jgi:hypothetical protein
MCEIEGDGWWDYYRIAVYGYLLGSGTDDGDEGPDDDRKSASLLSIALIRFVVL